jgi:hypothetical protein
MLKEIRDGIVQRVQPISIHGQISWDVFFTSLEAPEGPVQVARMGPEAVAGPIEPGDQIRVEYLLGVAVRASRVAG